jgi:hypothetical protein
MVPAGMRARLEGADLRIVGDDLRDFLVANRRPSSGWRDDLPASPEVTSAKGLLFVSGGLDSAAVLLSHSLTGNPLRAVMWTGPAPSTNPHSCGSWRRGERTICTPSVSSR